MRRTEDDYNQDARQRCIEHLSQLFLRVKAQVECSPGLDSYSDLRANASTGVVKDVIEVVESVFGDTITEDGTAED